MLVTSRDKPQKNNLLAKRLNDRLYERLKELKRLLKLRNVSESQKNNVRNGSRPKKRNQRAYDLKKDRLKKVMPIYLEKGYIQPLLIDAPYAKHIVLTQTRIIQRNSIRIVQFQLQEQLHELIIGKIGRWD